MDGCVGCFLRVSQTSCVQNAGRKSLCRNVRRINPRLFPIGLNKPIRIWAFIGLDGCRGEPLGRPEQAFSLMAQCGLGCPAFSGLLNLRSLCGELRIQVFGADFAWCPVAECGVNSSLIVEQFDVAGNVLLRFLP